MPFTQGLCPLIQTSLARVAQENTGYLNRTPAGFLESLISDVNTVGFEQINIHNGNGGNRRVGITYVQPTAVSAVLTSKPALCTAPNVETTPREFIVDPASLLQAYSPVQFFSEVEMAKLCDPTQDVYRATVLYAQMNAVINAIDRALLTQALTLFGNPYNTGPGPYTYVPPVAPLAAPIIKAADRSANRPGWISNVEARFEDLGMVGMRPIVVGAGNDGIYNYVRLIDEGCCNDGGIDLSASRGDMYFFRDRNVDTVLGTNNFIVYAPGAFQLIQYNEYTTRYGANPRNKMSPEKFEHDTIIDPFTGVEFDFKMQYDECTERYLMSVGTSFMLWALPADMYATTDPRFGVRNSLRFNATFA